MPETYDSREKLVAAELRREELRQLCYATSGSLSISLQSSSFSISSSFIYRFQFDNWNSTNLQVERNRNPVKPARIRRNADPVEPEWINVRNIAHRDRTTEVTTDRTKKIVLKLDIDGDKSKRQALKTVARFSGVDSMAVDMKKKRLTVVGDIDVVALTTSLRELFNTDLMFVGPAKEPNPKPKKNEPRKQELKLKPKKNEPRKEEPKREKGVDEKKIKPRTG